MLALYHRAYRRPVQKLKSLDVRTVDAPRSPTEVTQEPIKIGGSRLLALDDDGVSLPFEQRFLWKRGGGSIDNDCDDSERVAAVLKSSRAYDVAFMDTSMPGVNGSEAMNTLCQSRG